MSRQARWTRAILAGALISLLAGPARAEEARLIPWIGAGIERPGERLTIESGAAVHDDRSLWVPTLQVGASWRTGLVETRGGLGLGLALATGHVPLIAGAQAVAVGELTGTLSVLGGAGLGLRLDASQATRSRALVELPVGLRWRAIELLYVPAVAIPIGSDDQPIFGGERRLSARGGVEWIRIELRVSVPGLSF